MVPSTRTGKKLEGLKVLVTGATGAVATPIVRALSVDNDVHALARLRTPGDAQKLHDSGATAVPFDLASGSFDDLDDDYDLVLNFAVRRSTDDDFEQEMVTGAEALGLLMQRCRRARAFFHCSSTAVYRPPGDRPAREGDPLGDHHGSQLPTYSIGKIVAEGVARSGARALGLPTVIARLGVPYGSVWGWPTRQLEDIAAGRPLVVHPTDPMLFSPIHEQDIVDQLGALVASAAVPATVVNWGGDEAVRMQEWCALMGDLVGTQPVSRTSDRAFRGAPVDARKRTAITGPTRVPWREGMAALVADWLALREQENGAPA
jgi:nucleoside-diphosphate-sugar epimerase